MRGALHPWAAFAAGSVFIAITATPSLGGYDVSTLFAWHAVLLTSAVALLIPAGLLSYSSGGGSCGGSCGGARRRHIILMAAAAVLAAAGYAAGYIAHAQGGKDHLALNRGNAARTAHVWLGLAALAALALQASGGGALALRLAPVPLHMTAGRAVFCLACAPLALAIYFRWLVLGHAAVGALLALALAVVLLAVLQ